MYATFLFDSFCLIVTLSLLDTKILYFWLLCSLILILFRGLLMILCFLSIIISQVLSSTFFPFDSTFFSSTCFQQFPWFWKISLMNEWNQNCLFPRTFDCIWLYIKQPMWHRNILYVLKTLIRIWYAKLGEGIDSFWKHSNFFLNFKSWNEVNEMM